MRVSWLAICSPTATISKGDDYEPKSLSIRKCKQIEANRSEALLITIVVSSRSKTSKLQLAKKVAHANSSRVHARCLFTKRARSRTRDKTKKFLRIAAASFSLRDDERGNEQQLVAANIADSCARARATATATYRGIAPPLARSSSSRSSPHSFAFYMAADVAIVAADEQTSDNVDANARTNACEQDERSANVIARHRRCDLDDEAMVAATAASACNEWA